MSKKTESIEIRVSPELKAALAARAEDEGRSMSDLVRDLIESERSGSGSGAGAGTRQGDGGGLPATDPGDDEMILPSRRGALRAALLSLPVAALGVVYALSAQTPATASSEFRVMFAELDANGDGRVEAPEFASFLVREEEFEPEADCADKGEPCTALERATNEIDRHDSDANGVITYDELEAFLIRERAEVFIEHDVNANGFVTADEFALVQAFHAMEDGEAIPAACRTLIEEETPEGAAEACDAGEHLRIEMAEFDANRDGRVALLEYLAH
ncbi:MAG: ribbon-helix-helix protein, CopG family [Pseudomonadota bacterium]